MTTTRVALAGSTGSIGTQTLDVVAAEPDRFELVALGASGRQPEVLIIPSKASFQVDGAPTVFVKNGARFEPKTIEVADSNGVDLVVSSGVNEGDNIALVDPRTVEGAGRP